MDFGLLKFTTSRGKPAFSLNGFCYRQDKRASDGRVFWRCLEDGYSARMVSDGFDDTPVARGTNDHTHAPRGESGLQRHCVSQMKKAAREGTTPVPQVYAQYSQQLHQHDPLASSTLLSESSLSATLYRARRSRYPRLPDNLQDLQNIPELFSHVGADHGERFLLANTISEANRSIVFASHSGLGWLADYDDWHLDGTFKAAPRLFTQLFTLHVIRDRKAIPCLYCLLPSKTKLCYRGVFRALKDFCEEVHILLEPNVITVDFEVALMSALSTEFAAASLHGCFFHFIQAVWRKIQFLGLSVPYQENAFTKTTCRQLMALPFLPEAELVNAFNFLEQVAEDNVGDDLRDLFTYYRQQWLENPAIPLAVWNCNGKDLRTNNSGEGFHSRFNRLVGRNHPNTWMLIEVLHAEKSRSEHLMSQMDHGVPMRVGRRKYSAINDRINTLEGRRVNAEVDVYEFLAAVGNMLHF